jgi:aminodeoxyfutalosine synthase
VTRFEEISTLDTALEPVFGKISDGQRLSFEDGLVLEHSDDLSAIAMAADCVRERMQGNRAGFISNVHIDYTNICISRCKFCAYWRNGDSDDAYELSPDEAVERVPDDVQEIHMVGGLNPNLSLGYFIELLATLRDNFPKATLKAFTAVEIHALCQRLNLDPEDVLRKFKNSGLGMLPGGGAEIFNDEIRREICPNKASADGWLDIHRIAHGLGIPSNTTMLYGHIEKPGHRIEHLIRLRILQDKTRGIVAHIPLPYLRGGNELARDAHPVDGSLDIRQIAIARLMLDNIPHIKAYWRALGVRLAQVGLRAGADDIDGTVSREDIMHEAGSEAPRGLSLLKLKQIIKGAGLEPYRRNSFHEVIEEVSV